MTMTEQRLIGANALGDAVSESLYYNPHPPGRLHINHINEHNHFLRMIMDAPTVDAVEVVHGRWEDVYCGRREIPRFQCSVCKEFALRKSERDWLGRWHEGQALTRYCPYCGAKMDGGNEDG
jgi:hypothetical protein